MRRAKISTAVKLTGSEPQQKGWIDILINSISDLRGDTGCFSVCVITEYNPSAYLFILHKAFSRQWL